MHCSQPPSAAAQVWTLGNARQSTVGGVGKPEPPDPPHPQRVVPSFTVSTLVPS